MWADSLAAKNTRSQFFGQWIYCIWTELLREKMSKNSEKPNGDNLEDLHPVRAAG
jgi:hypothetical protein